MKTRNTLLITLAAIALGLFAIPLAQAQTCDGTGNKFVDLDGDGFNDNAPDADGDGIPNGLDEDYIKHAQDGTGYQHAYQNADKHGQDLEDEIAGKFQTKFMSKSQQFYRLQAANGYTFRWRNGSPGENTGIGMGACNGFAGSMSGTSVGDGSGPNGPKATGK